MPCQAKLALSFRRGDPPSRRNLVVARGDVGASAVANSTGRPSSLTVRALDPATGRVHGTTTFHVPSTRAWTSWQTVPVALTMANGTNLVVCSVEVSDKGAVNLDLLSE